MSESEDEDIDSEFYDRLKSSIDLLELGMSGWQVMQHLQDDIEWYQGHYNMDEELTSTDLKEMTQTDLNTNVVTTTDKIKTEDFNTGLICGISITAALIIIHKILT